MEMIPSASNIASNSVTQVAGYETKCIGQKTPGLSSWRKLEVYSETITVRRNEDSCSLNVASDGLANRATATRFSA